MPIPDTVTRTLDYAGSTPMSLGAAAANRAAGVGATCALNPTSGARAECALNSTYNTHGEPLYGHSTTNGTDVNGTVLPYASEVPASPPYKYPPPADAVSGMPAAGGAAKVNPFTTFERPATAPPPPSVPAVWAPGQAPGTMLPSEAGARSPARPPPRSSLTRTRLSSPQRPQRVAPPPAHPPAARPTSHPPRSLPPHRRPRGRGGHALLPSHDQVLIP